MEDLTKTQIVLLTLLVSFITSIATGIITTSLLAQAPANVTQTIDRVVERTVERVVPQPAGAGATVREVTIVKEGDAIVASIDQSTKSIVRIKSPAGTDGVQNFYALGVVVSRTGLILTDKRDVNPNVAYTVLFSDGTTLQTVPLINVPTGNLTVFKLQTDEAHLKNLAVANISKTDPKLGQTVIAIEGREKNAIAVGRILTTDSDAGTALTDIPAVTETQGGPLLNLSGELIGMKTSNADLTLTGGNYTVASSLSKFVAAHQ